jgi:hypothetical protein
MSVNHHTPYTGSSTQVTNTNLNLPLGELDSAITQIISGAISLDFININGSSSSTISSGAITPTKSLIVVDTEGAAASDTLDTISGGSEGQILFIRCANASRVVTLSHG